MGNKWFVYVLAQQVEERNDEKQTEKEISEKFHKIFCRRKIHSFILTSVDCNEFEFINEGL